MQKIKKPLLLITGGGFTLLGLYLGFRNIPIDSILHHLSQFDLFWIFPAIFLSLFSFVLRTIRWQLILKQSVKLNFFDAFHPLMAGFMVNCIFPARIGELVRPAVIFKRFQVPFSAGVSTIAVERMFDMVCMLIFLAVVLACVTMPSDSTCRFGAYTLDRNMLNQLGVRMIQVLLIVFVIIRLLCIDSIRQAFYRGIAKVPNWFKFAGPGIHSIIEKFVQKFLLGSLENISSVFLLLKNTKQIVLCLLLSFGLWTVQAAAWYAMSFGFDGLDLNFFQISAVMILVCFFIALPSAPGYWGLWEVAGIYAMQLFGTPKELSASYTLVNHAVQVFTMIGIGAVSAFLCGINIRRIFEFK
jgi:uncharacterized protein (TIRG00374 family)